MKLQYSHFRDHEYNKYSRTYTVAVYQPNKVELYLCEQQLLEGRKAELKISIGIAKLYHQDQFCKRIGRETAKSRMKFVSFELTEIRRVSGKTYYYFMNSDGSYRAVFFLSHNHNSAFFNHISLKWNIGD